MWGLVAGQLFSTFITLLPFDLNALGCIHTDISGSLYGPAGRPTSVFLVLMYLRKPKRRGILYDNSIQHLDVPVSLVPSTTGPGQQCSPSTYARVFVDVTSHENTVFIAVVCVVGRWHYTEVSSQYKTSAV